MGCILKGGYPGRGWCNQASFLKEYRKIESLDAFAIGLEGVEEKAEWPEMAGGLVAPDCSEFCQQIDKLGR